MTEFISPYFVLANLKYSTVYFSRQHTYSTFLSIIPRLPYLQHSLYPHAYLGHSVLHQSNLCLESAKLHALRALVYCVLLCLMFFVFYSLLCLMYLLPYVHTCLNYIVPEVPLCLMPYMLSCFSCLVLHVSSCFTYLISYMLYC